MANAPDLWPADIAETTMRTPISILREQGRALGDKTSQLVIGDVTTQTSGGKFYHSFNLRVSTVDYTYQLFRVHHGVMLYPVTITWRNKAFEGPTEDEFLELLRHIFNDETTKQIVKSLVAQGRG